MLHVRLPYLETLTLLVHINLAFVTIREKDLPCHLLTVKATKQFLLNKKKTMLQ
jgi:hypothetical protein